jgi:hypothetical protein
MKKVFSTDDRLLAGHIHSVLEAQNIGCWIKNLNLSGAIGELPPTECWPEIWIHDDDDYPLATKIIQDINSPATGENKSWTCQCGEINEVQFQICWRCGADSASV